MQLSTAQNIPHFIQRDSDNIIYLDLYADSTRIQPDSGATVSIYDGSGIAILSDEAVTVGQPSYLEIDKSSLPTTLNLSDSWSIEWTVTYDNEEYIIREDAHLVLRKIYPVVTQETLYQRHFELRKMIPKDRETWQNEINEAWNLIVIRLISQGQFPYLVMNPWAFREIHLYWSLSIIFRELIVLTSNSKYGDFAKLYEDKGDAAWNAIQFKYDVNQSNLAGDSQSVQAQAVVFLSGTNRSRGYWRTW